jgi:Spy/CpxP family protein refolding chaperone
LKKQTITVLSFAAIGAGLFLTPAMAQDRPDPAQMVEMRVDRMNETLKLNKDQRKQITAIYMDAQSANQSVMGGMREANQALAAAIKSNDSSAMSQAANTIGTLTAQMTVANAKAEAAVYALLTPDQQAKYQPGGMRGMGMGMGGPGGPGGPGGGGRRRGGPPQE